MRVYNKTCNPSTQGEETGHNEYEVHMDSIVSLIQSQPGIHSEALCEETQSVGDIVQSELECLPKHIFLDKKDT